MSNPARRTVIARDTLIALLGFSAVSAVGGSVAMLATDGMGMPRAMLRGSPFDSFVGPAVILFIVVGGTQLAAVIHLVARRRSALLWSAVAGFGLTIWIIVETVMIGGFSVLQAIYVAAGLLEIALVLALLGIVHRIPRLNDDGPAEAGPSR